MPTAFGPCRFGQYNKFHRMVLDDLGFEEVPIYTLDQERGYHDDIESLGSSFKLDAWRGIVFVDYLQKLARETRPHETEAGRSDTLYEDYLKRAQFEGANGRDFDSLAQRAVDAFAAVSVERTPKPLIGIVGEIYVRSNAFSNDFLVSRIERLVTDLVVGTDVPVDAVVLASFRVWAAHFQQKGCDRNRVLLVVFVVSEKGHPVAM